MDNFRFNIIADSESTYKNAMAIAMSQHSKAVGYELKDSKLILYWTKASTNSNMCAFPCPMSVEDIIPFVWSFIQKMDVTEKVDIDGSVGKAFHIYNEAWGHIDNQWDAFVAIEVVPALYGK